MSNRALFGATGLVLAVLLAALAGQTVRVAQLQTSLASMAKDLGEANTRTSLLEASAKALSDARDGLTAQVEACQQANVRAQARAADRCVIIRGAKPVPARAGKVVDDATSRNAAVHINHSCRD